MLKVLIPVDGSECSRRATRKLVEMLGWCKEPPQIDLLAVHLPVPRFTNMSVVVSDEMIALRFASSRPAGHAEARCHRGSVVKASGNRRRA